MEDLQALAGIAEDVNRGRERPLFLLFDEPYRAFAYDGVEVPPALPLSRYACVLGSFSKTLSLAGERIGYFAANPEMPDHFPADFPDPGIELGSPALQADSLQDELPGKPCLS